MNCDRTGQGRQDRHLGSSVPVKSADASEVPQVCPSTWGGEGPTQGRGWRY